MSTTPQVAPKWWPPLKDNPSHEDLILHTRLLYNAANQHDQAINTLYAQINALKKQLGVT
jgi:hypothetical protein